MPTSNQSFEPDFSKELDIESIISAPLVAASKANVMMVTGQTRFLLEYCFTKGENNTYAPVMITMSMTKGVIDETKTPSDSDYIKSVQMTFGMPLLCLIPINSLAVDKVTVDFDMEITSAISKQTTTANDSGNQVIEKKAQLNGKISNSSAQDSGNPNSTQYKSQVSSSLKVNINAGSLPLPKGVLTILDLYTKSIQPIAVSDQSKEQTIDNSK
jgi:hypothetical protein